MFRFLSFIAVYSVFSVYTTEAYVNVLKSKQQLTLRKLNAITEIATEAETKEDLNYDIDSWRMGYKTCKKESAEALTGEIPHDLEGTYFRNGMGKFEVGNYKKVIKILHPFDADGMISAITMKGGNVTYRNSYVRTRAFMKELKTRQMAARGTFGNHKFPGVIGNFLSLKLKNVGNTNVIWWGGRLLALYEGGLPYKLDPKTLRTEPKEYTMRGLLKKGETLTAHPRVDAKNDRLIAFSDKKVSLELSTLRVFEFDNKLGIVKERTFDVPGFGFFHDFVVTENYYIFNNPPLAFDAIPFVLGQKAPAECIKYQEGKKSTFYIVPRNGALPAQELQVPAHFNFHYANAFENEKGEIVLDMVKGDKMVLGTDYEVKDKEVQTIWDTMTKEKFAELSFNTLQRYTLTPSASKTETGQPSSWSFDIKKLSDKQLEFSSINTKVSCQKHRYIYCTHNSGTTVTAPVKGLLKIDVELGIETAWMGMADEFLGEPVFAKRKDAKPDADEDDGYILSFLNNWKADLSEFVVFDAKDISKGPIYRSALPAALPHGLHGTYADGLTFDQDDTISKWRAANSLDRQPWNEVNSGFSGLGISYDL
mmetsp:Transcript_2587/g.2693  ORF Transcript_2587/g.2693 Transcript_2587/m.2693 type:complete len:593 (+) Transcript_2587:54-1832(+)